MKTDKTLNDLHFLKFVQGALNDSVQSLVGEIATLRAVVNDPACPEKYAARSKRTIQISENFLEKRMEWLAKIDEVVDAASEKYMDDVSKEVVSNLKKTKGV